MVGASPWATASLIWEGDREDNMVLAVLGRIPETDNNNLNISRSDFSEKPNRVWESSLICKWVNNCTFSESPIFENVCSEILTKYPTPAHSMTKWVGFFSTSFPFKCVIIFYLMLYAISLKL